MGEWNGVFAVVHTRDQVRFLVEREAVDRGTSLLQCTCVRSGYLGARSRPKICGYTCCRSFPYDLRFRKLYTEMV